MKKPKKPRSIKRIILLIANIVAFIYFIFNCLYVTNGNIDSIIYDLLARKQFIFLVVSLVIYYLSIIADAFDRAYRDFENEEEPQDDNKNQN